MFTIEHYPLQKSKHGWWFESYLICPECGQIDEVESDYYKSREQAVEYRTKMKRDVEAGNHEDYFGPIEHNCSTFWEVQTGLYLYTPRENLTPEDIAILEEYK